MTRAEVVRAANEIRRSSRDGGAPVLSEASDLVDLCAWLQWNDPNGSHTAALAQADDIEPHDLASAWGAIAEQVATED